MAVITVSRQMGSAGDYVANLVASMLSYKLVNKQSIIMEARKRGLVSPEAVDELGEGKPSLLERFVRDRSRLIYAMRSILRELAIEGNAVIVGRGACMELKNRDDLFNARVIADSETRIARIMKENGIERVQAIKRLKQSDKDRSQYVKHFFLVDWSDPELYDIVINTSRISPDVAARLIIQSARHLGVAKG